MSRSMTSVALLKVGIPGARRRAGAWPAAGQRAARRSAFAILGFAQPAFWLLGLAAEAVIAASLGFQSALSELRAGAGTADRQRRRRGQTARPDSTARFRSAQPTQQSRHKCDRILDISQTQQAEDYVIDSQSRGVEEPAMGVPEAAGGTTSSACRRPTTKPKPRWNAGLPAIDHELAQGDEPDSLRQSKAATQIDPEEASGQHPPAGADAWKKSTAI